MKKVNEGVAEEAARSESKVLRLFELFLITYTYGWPIDMETTEERLDSINSYQVGIFISHIENGIMVSTCIMTELN